MAQKTIQCRLVAPVETRQYLWTLAAEKNTPLINALIQGIVTHEDFETWRIKGRHPADVVTKLCKRLKAEAPFSGQPSRFYASAEKAVNYIFKSWFTLQRRLQQQISGKQTWLTILQSDHSGQSRAKSARFHRRAETLRQAIQNQHPPIELRQVTRPGSQ